MRRRRHPLGQTVAGGPRLGPRDRRGDHRGAADHGPPGPPDGRRPCADRRRSRWLTKPPPARRRAPGRRWGPHTKLDETRTAGRPRLGHGPQATHPAGRDRLARLEVGRHRRGEGRLPRDTAGALRRRAAGGLGGGRRGTSPGGWGLGAGGPPGGRQRRAAKGPLPSARGGRDRPELRTGPRCGRLRRGGSCRCGGRRRSGRAGLEGRGRTSPAGGRSRPGARPRARYGGSAARRGAAPGGPLCPRRRGATSVTCALRGSGADVGVATSSPSSWRDFCRLDLLRPEPSCLAVRRTRSAWPRHEEEGSPPMPGRAQPGMLVRPSESLDSSGPRVLAKASKSFSCSPRKGS